MKQQALRTIAILGFLLMLTAAPAYSQAEQLRANIPFPFIVGEKTLPAGTYRVERVRTDSSLVWVIQAAGKPRYRGVHHYADSEYGDAGGDEASLSSLR